MTHCTSLYNWIYLKSIKDVKDEELALIFIPYYYNQPSQKTVALRSNNNLVYTAFTCRYLLKDLSNRFNFCIEIFVPSTYFHSRNSVLKLNQEDWKSANFRQKQKKIFASLNILYLPTKFHEFDVRKPFLVSESSVHMR